MDDFFVKLRRVGMSKLMMRIPAYPETSGHLRKQRRATNKFMVYCYVCFFTVVAVVSVDNARALSTLTTASCPDASEICNR